MQDFKKIAKDIVHFQDYVCSFYDQSDINALYPVDCRREDISAAIFDYLAECIDPRNDLEWGEGDSLDRERVRAILDAKGFKEKIVEKRELTEEELVVKLEALKLNS